MRKTAFSLSLILICSMLLLAGCNRGYPAGESTAPPDTTAQATSAVTTTEAVTGVTEITLTVQAGREVTIKPPGEMVVSCYYISSSTCIALGLTDKMAGVEAKAGSRPIYKMAAPSLLYIPDLSLCLLSNKKRAPHRANAAMPVE